MRPDDLLLDELGMCLNKMYQRKTIYHPTNNRTSSTVR